jgi:uncharacterized caspase-like protein
MRVLVFILICLTISVDIYSQEGEGTSKAQKFEIRPQNTYRGDPLKGLNLGEELKALEFGRYFALIIGIDKYTGTWPPLQNAVNDAKAVEIALRDNYRIDHFITLYNEEATRASIIRNFEALVETVSAEDNVFIFYSGHGDYKESLNKGYWVPVDASGSSTSNYISNSDIQTFLGGIKSKHTLLVSDACFSGDIFRGETRTIPFEDSEKYYQTVHAKASRKALTSGGVEPVLDGGREGHSIFTYYFLQALEENKQKLFDASRVYEHLKIPVINNSDQSPVFAPVKNAGDEGGQFIFIRK